MTVSELCELMTDTATIEIFSFEKGDSVFFGYNEDIPEELQGEEIASIDEVYPETKHLTINID